MQHLQRQPPEFPPVAALQVNGDRRLSVQSVALYDLAIIGMAGQRCAEFAVHVQRAPAVVRMPMRDDDLGNRRRVHLFEVRHPLPVVILALPPRIDEHGRLGAEHEKRVRRRKPGKRSLAYRNLMDARF